MQKTITGIALAFMLIMLTILAPVPRASAATDFGDLESPSGDGINEARLNEQIDQIWSGTSPDIRGLEAGLLGDDLLWTYVSGNKLYFKAGEAPAFSNPDREIQISGEIVALDYYGLPHAPGKGLVTVNYKSMNSFRTNVYSVTQTETGVEVEQFQGLSNRALRPVGQFMYGQAYAGESRWSPAVHRYRTTRTGYEQDEQLDLPDSTARVLSMTSLPDGRWALINAAGDLQIVADGSLQMRITGDFGITSQKITLKESIRPMERSEFVRLAPDYLPEDDLLAVALNPKPTSRATGFLGMNVASQTSTIELINIAEEEPTSFGQLGPLQGRVLDVDVPRANERQLLWLRTPEPGRYVLEMLDFRDITAQ